MAALRSAAVLCLLAAAGRAEMSPDERQRHLASFDYVWRTIHDKHFDPNHLKKIDWDGARATFRPRIETADSAEAVRDILNNMIGRLGQTHFGVVPGVVYGKIESNPSGGGASPGIDLRVLDGDVTVIRVDPGGGAEAAGVKPGWVAETIAGTPVAPVVAEIRKQFANSTLFDIVALKGLLGRLEGGPGSRIAIGFRTPAGSTKLEVERRAPRGVIATFGHFPAQHIWIETKKIGPPGHQAGYVRFNMFFDPSRLMPMFNDLVSGCITGCAGIVIDLRGNPGGIGAMSMGMAGWFVSGGNRKLGTMTMQGNALNFAISPRAQTFDGPVAILIDGASASTSEILAAGMQDLGRARLFGTRTAGAALPSVFERLPNGDGFQYATADYVSAGGKVLEGAGVIPDEVIRLTRAALEAGQDPVLDRALQWIQEQTK